MNVKILLIFCVGFAPFFTHAGDAAKGEAISGACASCHGPYGLSGDDQYPNLAGQKEAYLIKQLQAFQTGLRANIAMQAQVGPLTAQNIEDLAAYYASNTTIPSYSSASGTGILTMPFVSVLTELYRVDMKQESDTVFSLGNVDELR